MKYLVVASLMALLAVAVSAHASEVVSVSQPVPIPVERVDIEKVYENVTKIVVEPKYKHLRLMPGDEKTFTVKLKNPNEKDVVVEPRVVTFPIFDNLVGKDWVSFDKSKFVLKAGESAEIKVTVKVPEDAGKGYYNSMVVFTNDSIQMPYPSVRPIYVNQMSLSVNVWVPPVVRIYPRFIDDRVEAGGSYEYKIYVENTGDHPLKMNPSLVREEGVYYDPFSPVTWMDDSLVTIEAPKVIEPKSKAVVKVKVNVPSSVKGILRASLNLNVEDPGLDEWMQRIDLNLQVYEKPSEPFVKTFAVENATKVTITVSTSNYGKGAEKLDEVDVRVVSPVGVVNLKPSRVVEEVRVSLSDSKLPPWEEVEGIYTVTGYKRTEVYTIENPVDGVWKVEVLPSSESFSLVVEVE
ncbi:hypothetical protein GAH_01729 [Geoglobus ahangari]|uniref:NPCBM-associated, NEW3 domain of alpha-galactosidase n=1 Tax=Geoglobus ahangari TaxID=113653 RepID=A0A0F7ICI7_9EURY|nr:hypothetical protein [Geoglobus ahangari]AKG90989.1 hypothetical protein GAH_01729 [Geoglobus ahangari]